jgi:Putative phage abortive infection protein
MTNSPDDAEREVAEAAEHVKKLTRFAYIGGAVAVLVLLAYLIRFAGPVSDSPANWGQFGDYVGGLLNPTFSFLALLALLATLGLQIRELRISARELKNSAVALVKQNDTLRQQTFEATFFQLLRLHNDIVGSLEFNKLSLTGRACLSHYKDELEGTLINDHAKNDYKMFRASYDIFYREHQSALGHYFRLLYKIVKLVKRTAGIDQRFYTNLVRAQLSSAELMLLFYNSLSAWGEEKFKPLVEEFALLKNMPNDVVPDDELLKRYSPAAFGGKYPTSWL